MYEKQGTPLCGALNTYIGNKCISEIADVIEDIALLRAEELHLLDSREDRMHRGIPKEQLMAAVIPRRHLLKFRPMQMQRTS